ncbi:MAG: hypothetical protein ACLP7I_12160 [Limisphaerales bacterium]
MIEFIKKFCTYFGATITFLIGVKAAVGIGFSWKLLAIVAVIVAVACAGIAWAEVFHRIKIGSSKLRGGDSGGSISLTIKGALGRVKFAARDDEAIALEANKIVRHGLDKHCISYEDYREWRRKNPMVFTAVTDSDNQLIGFFDVFPLTEEAAQGLIGGKIDERGLKIEAILPYENNGSAKNIYVASIMLNPHQTAFSRIVAKEVLLLKFADFLNTVFPPNEERMLFAYAHSDFGEKLLKNTEFRNTSLSRDNKQGAPLYELSPAGYRELAKSFSALLGGKGSIKRHRAPELGSGKQREKEST